MDRLVRFGCAAADHREGPLANNLCINDAALVEELPREEDRASRQRSHVRGALPASGRGFTSDVAATGRVEKVSNFGV